MPLDPDHILGTLEKLRSLDPDRRMFGASSHDYRLASAAPADRVEAFEALHNIRLPEDYRRFVLEVGNGGAGPYYGVFPLGLWDGSGAEMESWEGDEWFAPLDRPYPHRTAWNVPNTVRDAEPTEGVDASAGAQRDWDEYTARFEEANYAPEVMAGAFPLAHHGCAIRSWLVVTGPEAGNVWKDQRSEHAGVCPQLLPGHERVRFADWYHGWLDHAVRTSQSDEPEDPWPG